ncbi:Similar to hypothetical protein TRIVIDRAFT_143504 [Trichoderma virens Gv29-8]; acc. no. EHK25113 [Pyronema omphalodes CBS 100304]|uniref:Uncharacterized protein n=1 Tax=Pyronema omphalodes (strain CBS 100304) TaxID=1076935 RepID=U4LU21_PYROM|nr:Similar to hypothetical protein TRIVIDRAFT_143504 [Trichoderma virens Gv29-8]; acc. no. EHK25113 [Pyronema omphalodes CBS 100304]
MIKPLENYKKSGKSPDFDAACEIMTTVLQFCSESGKTAWFVVDALDEFRTEHRKSLLKYFRGLLNLNSAKLLFTSRPNIKSEIQDLFCSDMGKTIDIVAHDEDIGEFVRAYIEKSCKPNTMTDSLKQEIISKLTSKSEGMSLFAFLQIERTLGMTSPRKKRKALENLPTGIPAACDASFDRIGLLGEDQKLLALKTIKWVHLALRGLKVEELLQYLAIKDDDTEFDLDNMTTRQKMLDCCLGLVTVDNETDTVRLVHYTLQEYLDSPTNPRFPKGHADIAHTCFLQCKFMQFNMYRIRWAKFYVKAWLHHTQHAKDPSFFDSITAMISQAQFECPIKFREYTIDTLRMDYYKNILENPYPWGLYLACYLGIQQIFHNMFKGAENFSRVQKSYALTVAVRHAHENIAQIFLDN